MALEWTPTRFAVGDFDSTKRYVREGAGGYALATGATITAAYNGTVSGNTYNKATWRFSIPGYLSMSQIILNFNLLSTPQIITYGADPGAPTPTVKAVKT